MRNTLGIEGLVGVILTVLAIGFLTWIDPLIGAGVMILLAGLALIAKGIADSTMRMLGMKQ